MIENLDLDNGDERVARIINIIYDTIHRQRPILDEPSIPISESYKTNIKAKSPIRFGRIS
jgi:hypothetical protein